MLKILFIGNSFSDDTTRYLQAVGKGEIFCRNLYIGGCSLQMHADNIAASRAAYCYNCDCEKLEDISINDALLREEWDVVSVQQVSYESGLLESYEPYLGYVIGVIRERCPRARIVFNRTWSYEPTSDHSGFSTYNCDSEYMFERILFASREAAGKYSLPIIPVGNAVSAARLLPEFNTSMGGEEITRDGFHLSLLAGRYLAALTAYVFFTQKSARGVDYIPDGVSYDLARKLKNIADAVTL